MKEHVKGLLQQIPTPSWRQGGKEENCLSTSFQSRDTPPQKKSPLSKLEFSCQLLKVLERFILLLSTSWSLPFTHVQCWGRDSLTGVLTHFYFPDWLKRPYRISPCRRSLRRWPCLHTELVIWPAEGGHNPEPPKHRKWIIGTLPTQWESERRED